MYFYKFFFCPKQFIACIIKAWTLCWFWEKKHLAITKLTPWEKCTLLGFTRSSLLQMVHHRHKRLRQTKKFYEIWEEKILTIKFEQFIWFVYGLVFSFVFVSIFQDNWHVDIELAGGSGGQRYREQSLWNSNNAQRMITCIHDLTK